MRSTNPRVNNAGACAGRDKRRGDGRRRNGLDQREPPEVIVEAEARKSAEKSGVGIGSPMPASAAGRMMRRSPGPIMR